MRIHTSIFSLIFYVLLAMKTRLLRSTNLQTDDKRELYQQHPFFEVLETIFGHDSNFFSETKNHLLSLITTKIDQIW